MKGHIDDVGQWDVPVKDMDVKPLLLQRSHSIQAFLFSRASPANPNFDTFEFAIVFGFSKPGNDSTKCFFSHL